MVEAVLDQVGKSSEGHKYSSPFCGRNPGMVCESYACVFYCYIVYIYTELHGIGKKKTHMLL